MKVIPVLLLLSLTISSAAEAQPGGFAAKGELVGYWEMIPIPNAAKVNKTNPWPIAYQWFGFYEDGTLATMGSSEYKPMTSKDLEEVFSKPSLKNGRFKYAFDPSGFVLVTAPDSSDYEEAWGVNVITREAKLGEMEVKPGDILMTLAGGEDGGIVYIRHLRRVK